MFARNVGSRSTFAPTAATLAVAAAAVIGRYTVLVPAMIIMSLCVAGSAALSALRVALFRSTRPVLSSFAAAAGSRLAPGAAISFWSVWNAMMAVFVAAS